MGGVVHVAAPVLALTSGDVKTVQVSSFDVVDMIIHNLLSDRTRFPNLERISLIGHSAGSQFIQR